MTKQEIEDYINTYRAYPQEYTGKRDKSVLRSMGSKYRFDLKNNMITRLEGRIDNNGDFKIKGLFRYPIDKPEEKVEILDDFEKSMALHFKYTLNKYNTLMRDLDHEPSVIEPGKNENWNIRDMLSEVEYLRSLYYTKGHERNRLRETDPDLFTSYTNRLRYFIRTYKPHISDLTVTVKHNSKYDN